MRTPHARDEKAACRHVVAHPHGSIGRARSDGCRCARCAPVAHAYDAERARALAYGTWTPWFDASIVAAHLRRLRPSMTVKAMAELAGVNRHTVAVILSGSTARVRTANAEALLALRTDPGAVDPLVLVDAAAAAAAVRDLTSQRTSVRVIADTAGVSECTIRRVQAAHRRPARPVRVRAWVGDALEALPRDANALQSPRQRPDPALLHPVVREAARLAAAGTLAAAQRRTAVAELTKRQIGAGRTAAILRVSERTVWRDRATLADRQVPVAA